METVMERFEHFRDVAFLEPRAWKSIIEPIVASSLKQFNHPSSNRIDFNHKTNSGQTTFDHVDQTGTDQVDKPESLPLKLAVLQGEREKGKTHFVSRNKIN